ncbi:MAG TPA: hypothetical protein VN671_03700 [Solirubrobacterales bacterium]|nr:hypothetical protein [Solirubrobacterales bacterium]
MGLFGSKNKEDRRAADAAAKAEADRLVALPVPDLAAEILPAFGPDGPGKGDKEIGTLGIGMFLLRDHPQSSRYVKQLVGPIREGIQALENEGMIERRVRNIGGSTVSVTRAGMARIGQNA